MLIYSLIHVHAYTKKLTHLPTCVNKFTFTHTNMVTHSFTYLHANIHADAHKFTHSWAHTNIHLNPQIYTQNTHEQVHTYTITHVRMPTYMHKITHSLIHKTGSHIHSPKHAQSLFTYLDIGTLICTHWCIHYLAQKCSSISSVIYACSQTDTQETQLYTLKCSQPYSFTHIHQHAHNSNMLTCSLTHKHACTRHEGQTLQQIGTLTYTYMLTVPSQKYANTWTSSQMNMI